MPQSNSAVNLFAQRVFFRLFADFLQLIVYSRLCCKALVMLVLPLPYSYFIGFSYESIDFFQHIDWVQLELSGLFQTGWLQATSIVNIYYHKF